MRPFSIVAFCVLIAATLVVLVAINGLFAAQWGPGRHRRRKVTTASVMARVGAWQFSVGLVLLSVRDFSNGISLLCVGIAFCCWSPMQRRLDSI